jgi:hypothetical protein
MSDPINEPWFQRQMEEWKRNEAERLEGEAFGRRARKAKDMRREVHEKKVLQDWENSLLGFRNSRSDRVFDTLFNPGPGPMPNFDNT